MFLQTTKKHTQKKPRQFCTCLKLITKHYAKSPCLTDFIVLVFYIAWEYWPDTLEYST